MALMDIPSPMAGSIKEILVAVGDTITVEQEVMIMESMKMEIPVESPVAGRVTEICVEITTPVDEGTVLLRLES